MNEQNTAAEVAQESPIETALAKENITQQVIQRLKTDYLGLVINGLDDKEGFNKVETARKECKSIRNLATNICKKGREQAIQIQKEWIAKEKEVVSEISIVEDYLEAQSNEIKELEKKVLFEAAQKMKLPGRKEKFKSIGVEVDEGVLLSVNDEKFNSLFNDLYEKYLAEKADALKAEEDRLARERAEAERNKREEEAEKKRLQDIEDAKEQARLKAEAEATERIAKAEQEKADAIERECKAKAEAKIEAERVAKKAEADKAEALRKAEEDKQKAIAKLKKEQEQKEEAERKEKAEAEAKAERIRIAAEKKAAKAPEKKRLLTWFDSVKINEIDTNTLSEDGKVVYADIQKRFAQFQNWATQLIENL